LAVPEAAAEVSAAATIHSMDAPDRAARRVLCESRRLPRCEHCSSAIRRSSTQVAGSRCTCRARRTVSLIGCRRWELSSMSSFASRAPLAFSPLTLSIRSPTRSPACSALLCGSIAQTRAPALGSDPIVTPRGPLAGSHVTMTVEAPISASDASRRNTESSALARCDGPATARHTAEGICRTFFSALLRLLFCVAGCEEGGGAEC